MLYLVNPRRKASAKKARRKKAASPAQLRARRKFAAMAKARAKAARGRKRASTGGSGMVKRRRKATKRRRRSTARRSPITRLRRHAVYATNPRRRTRRVKRRGYRRNPGMGGIGGQAFGLVKDAGATLIGAAVGRTVSNLIPLGGDTPVMGFVKSALIAVGLKVYGKRFLGERFASYAAVGAMIGPTKDLIVSFVPGAASFLGESGPMYFPSVPAGLRAYSDTDISAGDDTSADMGSYSGDIYSV